MAIKLTKSEVLSFQTNGELMGRLSHADLIAVHSPEHPTGCIVWARPPEEVLARESKPPLNIEVLRFEVSSEEELEQIQTVINQLKYGD